MAFWEEVFIEVSKNYPDVKTYPYLIDTSAIHFVTDPRRFEINSNI